MLRRIFGPKRDEVRGEWGKLHNEELLTNYCLSDQMEKNEMRGACRAYGGGERLINGFSGEDLRERDHLGDPGLDGKILLRWIFRKWDVGVWTGSSRLRIGTLVNAVTNLRVPQNAGDFLTSCKPVSFSRWTLLHAVSECV